MTKLVFWHGWGMSPAVWTNLIGELKSRLPVDTRYDAMPLPGYAGTVLPEGDPVSIWVDALMKNVSEPVVLCGWSMGAIMALSAAHRYPEKVAALVLFGATPCFAERRDWDKGVSSLSEDSFRKGVQTGPDTTLRRFVTLFNRSDRNARAIVRQLASLEIPPVSVLEAGLDFLAAADFRAIVPEIRQKTLLIHGANDPLMPPGAAGWLAEALPDARLHLLSDVAHAPFLSDPRQCSQLIEEFVNG